MTSARQMEVASDLINRLDEASLNRIDLRPDTWYALGYEIARFLSESSFVDDDHLSIFPVNNPVLLKDVEVRAAWDMGFADGKGDIYSNRNNDGR